MIAACVLVGGQVLASVATAFTLTWTHSVEKTAWRERWQVTSAGLLLTEAAIKGSGAGMDPGDGAVLEDGWLVWRPGAAPVPALFLAASGDTISGWRLCGNHDEDCRTLGAQASQPIEIAPCDETSR
jgi:hypothetical protein